MDSETDPGEWSRIILKENRSITFRPTPRFTTQDSLFLNREIRPFFWLNSRSSSHSG